VRREELKAAVFDLIREDREFRHALAGALGILETLEAIRALQEQVAENTRAIRALQEQVAEHSRAIRALQEQVRALQEQMRDLQKQVIEHSKVIRSLQEHIGELSRTIHALGSRWGILAEEAFRNALVGIVGRRFGGEVRRWVHRDEEGFVFGEPSVVEVDVVVADREHVLVEIKSSVSRADVYELWRVGQLYERVTGVKPKLAIVSPFVERRAEEAARKLGIEVYTSLSAA